MLYEGDANLSGYLQCQRDAGSTVNTYTLPTTLEVKCQIYKNCNEHGYASPGSCTTATSNAIKDVGPFKGLETYLFPRSLESALQKLMERK